MNAPARKRVAVLMGGTSAEREVSLESGRQCAEALREAGYDTFEIDVTADIRALLDALDPRPDVVFNALHGNFGEDGNIQGLLNLLDLPYTHSGVLSSALAMDKAAARAVFATEGLGIALMPQSLAAAPGRPIVALTIAPQPPQRTVAMTWRSNLALSPPARAFLELTLDWIDQSNLTVRTS